MTVGDLQRYLHGLADAVNHAPLSTPVVQELRSAADALGTFAPVPLPEFIEFLKNAWRYSLTGEVAAPVPSKLLKSKLNRDRPTPTLDGLRATVAALTDPIQTPLVSGEQIRRELEVFRRLTDAEWTEMAISVGMVGVSNNRYIIIREMAKLLAAKRGVRGEQVSAPPGSPAAKEETLLPPNVKPEELG